MELDNAHRLLTILQQIVLEVMSNEGFSTNMSNIRAPKMEKSVQISLPCYNANNLGWLKDEILLHKLYSVLLSHGDIACSFENFKNHFLGRGETREAITWQSEITLLVYLIFRLREEGFIPLSKTHHKILTLHFIDRHGRMLKNGSLRTSLNQIRHDQVGVIDSIINELVKAESMAKINR